MDEADGGDRGFVLITVIWLSALFALFSMGFVRNTQLFVRDISSQADLARAEAIAESGVNLALLDLIASRRGGDPRYPPNYSMHACSFSEDSVLTIRVQDAAGRVNINTAGPRLLQALIMGLGADRDTAERYADRIIDFRDPDDETRPFGAERPAYLAAGVKWGPKNAPLDAIEELRQVLGLDPAMADAIAGHSTLFSGMAGVDPKAASPELAAILATGARQLAGGLLGSGFGDTIPEEFSMASPRRAYVIQAEGKMASGATFVREAVVDFATLQSSYHVIRLWRRGRAFGGAGAGVVLPACR